MRLIDADDLRTHINNVPMHGDHKVFYDIMSELVSVVAAAPTIDAVEVVRCAKCAEFDDGTCRLLGLRTVYNDFCSYGYCDEGERMDAEEDGAK